MKIWMSIVLLAGASCLAGPSVASAQSGNPKFQPRRATVLTTSHRSPAARTSWSAQTTPARGTTHSVLPAGHIHGGCGCEAAPSCGCDTAPSCGCDTAPACGCDGPVCCDCPTAPACGCRTACVPLLPALMRGLENVLDCLVPCKTGCGYACPVYPVPSCHGPHHRRGLLPKLGMHGNCCDSCAPSCGCGADTWHGDPQQISPLVDPFQDDIEMLAPPAPPSEARRMPSVYRQYSQSGLRPAPVAPRQATAPARRQSVERTSHAEPRSTNAQPQPIASPGRQATAAPTSSLESSETSEAQVRVLRLETRLSDDELQVPVPPAAPAELPVPSHVPYNPLRPNSR